MSLLWGIALVCVAAFDLPMHSVVSQYRFALWNSEPLSLRDSLTEVVPDPVMNTQYHVNISLGMPSQELSFIVSMASPWLAVSTPQCEDCLSDHDFNSTQSSSFRGSKRRLVLDDFEASVAEENVTFSDNPEIQIGGQKLLLIKKSPFMNSIQAEGVLGLAYNKLLWDDLGLIENLKRHKIIKKMIFAIYIYDPDMGNTTNTQTTSILSIGEYDLEKYARGELAYMHLAGEPGQWKVVLSSAKFGDEELITGYGLAAIDAGVSLMVVPNDVYLHIQYALCWEFVCLFEENLITFKCDDIPETLPDITLVMDQATIVITPSMYMKKEHGMCRVLIVPFDSNTWILGTLLLKRYYAVFDMEHHKIGLAPSVNIPPLGGLWILWVFLVIVVLGGMAAAYFIYRRKKQANGLESLLGKPQGAKH